MIKTELIDAIARRTQLTKKEANQVLEAILDSITDALSKGDKVQLVGFGTFEVRHREARSGRNPQTGESINIGERNVPVFKPGKLLKDAVK